MTKKEVGHNFLARLGKKRLRPGGIIATNWLISQGHFSKEKTVLEVACNMCTTSIELAQTYRCHITGLDTDPKALERARDNIARAKLEDLISVQEGNAMRLPFEDNSFDIVINEAMLTMLQDKAKEKALAEYLRVLKPGGVLLTHDVAYEDPDLEQTINQLRTTINANVQPLQVDDWKRLSQKIGFHTVTIKYGPMTLMSPVGMIKDEGFVSACKILYRGMKKENRQQFLTMFRFFNKNRKKLRYIAMASQK
ncbi:class I SAM-dependent methyltransferase [Streptococcus dentapri]|uniref:Class I SAM-dependent methyltransferase n=1 Tax=Streptococcus dentapri TaxID=573564 RepID=A0ABV8D092_9STRE